MSPPRRRVLSVSIVLLAAFAVAVQLRSQVAKAWDGRFTPYVTIVFPTKTPRPTSTPRATATPRPTRTPQPKATPRPTRTPTPTATALPQSLSVTTTADSALCPTGPGNPGYSLRCAITQVDRGNPGRTITFAIPASDPGCHSTPIAGKATTVCTISPTRALPTLTAGSVVIDGFSQAGASPNTGTTLSSGDDAVIAVQLDGAASTGGGLEVSHATGVTIRGLAITNFHAGAGISVSTASHIAVVGNLIGLAPDGSSAGNKAGVSLNTVSDTTVGGSAPGDRNVISASAGTGISVAQGADDVIAGNLIGTNVRGTNAVGNAAGVSLSGAATSKIGGVVSGSGNVISGNRGDGVSIQNGPGYLVSANIIGADASGKRALANHGNGVSVGGHARSASVENNLIAYNRRIGIFVGQSGPRHANAALLKKNLVFGNKRFGIDIAPVGSANCSIALKSRLGSTLCPVIETVSAGEATGTACQGCTVELYLASSGTNDQGFGEGKKLLGSAVARNGTWRITIRGRFDPSTQQVTATATRGSTPRATSEFALDMPVRVSFRYLTAHLVTVFHKATKRSRARTLDVGIKVDWRPTAQTGIAGFQLYMGGQQVNSRPINANKSGAYDYVVRFPARTSVNGRLILGVTLLNGLTVRVPFGLAR